MTPPVAAKFGNYQQQQCATTIQYSKSKYDYSTCKGCSQWHWASQKKCNACGMKKSWAEAVAPKQWAPPCTQNQEWTAAEWEGWRERKRSQLSPKTLSAVHSSIDACSSAQMQSIQGTQTMQPTQDGQSAREKLAEELNMINDALKFLPDSPVLQETRNELTARQEVLKKQISATRPLASRLDSCIAAVERAKKRLNQVAQKERAPGGHGKTCAGPRQSQKRSWRTWRKS